MVQRVISSESINAALTVDLSSHHPDNNKTASLDRIIDEIFLSLCSSEEREFWINKMSLEVSP